MTDQTEAAPSAYDLLSKPTLDLTDAEVEAVVVDLRKRRELYISTGKPDRPKPPKAPATKAKADADEKKRNTAALLASLNLKI